MTADAALWLEQILAALDEAQSGPTPEDLAMAPMLSPWHPILGTRWIITARLIALDPGNRWARTFSHWYRQPDPARSADGVLQGPAARLPRQDRG